MTSLREQKIQYMHVGCIVPRCMIIVSQVGVSARIHITSLYVSVKL